MEEKDNKHRQIKKILENTTSEIRLVNVGEGNGACVYACICALEQL